MGTVITLRTIVPNKRTGSGKLPPDAVTGQPAAEKNDVEIHHSIGCKKLHKILFICTGCKTSKYCSRACQVKDLANHKQIWLEIHELSVKFEKAGPGRGDGEDSRVFVSHLTPQGQEKLSKLVGRKCLIKCKMNDVELPVLFDTGAQVSINSSKQLKTFSTVRDSRYQGSC